MATQNKVSGRITHLESGNGIPQLIVEVFDLDPSTVNPDQDGIFVTPGRKLEEETFEAPAPDPTTGQSPVQALPADRLGSVMTDENGYFELFYDDDAFRIRKRIKGPDNSDDADIDPNIPDETRPDLYLLVTAPDKEGVKVFQNVLYRSNWARINAGREETYLISLTTQQLENAKIPVPVAEGQEATVTARIAKHVQNMNSRKQFREGMREYFREVDEVEKEEREKFRNTIKAALLPNREILNSMYNFVSEGQTIAEVQQSVYQQGADNIQQLISAPVSDPMPGKGIKVNLFLTDEEKAELAEYSFIYEDKEYFNIPENLIQQLLFKRENDEGINTILFSNNPISKACIVKSKEDKCAEKHVGEGSSDEEGTEDVEEPINRALTQEDIPYYLQSILFNKDAHLFKENGQSANRPDAASVQKSVDNFALEKGPADATAFYDFHSLQIAFQYVWQQLLDETLVNLTEQVQSDLENQGNRGLSQLWERVPHNGGSSPLFNILNVAGVDHSEVPTEIQAAFDITFLEYDALKDQAKTKLGELALEINFKEEQTSTGQQTLADATYVALLRDQGERLIDNVRINKPFSTNEMLRELQERLLSKYEFTVFAADRDYHSINFGLMNTYRQKWEPLNYQVGKLVKTLPMSPKEERKYSVKTVRKVKNVIKEAQKNNSTLQSEMNTTSRAEAEIVGKAQSKSNFNMSINVDYTSVKSGLSFAKDAAKESSEARKDFREAVIKAAQEYKEERSLQIDTEQTFDSEYSESGTVVNPNSELSLTYLFYELQRRYRVSEQLYRVMPVVMVAQQVPAPDEITKAWIVAHDWIINRVLLDDSFRPTLQYIAQKNVGDDFAIRELRKNLRQQRSLVNSLKIEFSKLRQNVEDKYALLQSRVRDRIDEEHDKRFYKFPWWMWYYRDRPDTPPDPEMAKAMEQAAADDHKHSVEQAKEMAMSVQREIMSLNQITSEYNSAMQMHWDLITQTRRLITHVKENILYYMQAIWSMEPPDQRYMRLYKVKVPHFEAERSCIVAGAAAEDLFEQFRTDGKKKHPAWLHGNIIRGEDGSPVVTEKELVEVADLDTLLGFKGNYMIFPLKEHNALTELMAAPYIDEAFGAMDPDQLSNINLEEYSRYICCLHNENPQLYETLKPVLRKWLERLLSDPLRNGDEIIVPTDSLFIEMLTSETKALEEFQLLHRIRDVVKVEAEVREMELENIRAASRILQNILEDPDIEKKIVIEGDGENIVLSEGD